MRALEFMNVQGKEELNLLFQMYNTYNFKPCIIDVF